MSRHKKRSAESSDTPRLGTKLQNGLRDRPLPPPNPPRPNKPFLAIAILLLVAWLGFLVAMALTGGRL